MTPPATVSALVAGGCAAGAFLLGGLSGLWWARKRSAPSKPEDLASHSRRGTEESERLARAEQELNGLIYSISHDVRAPLRSIDGFSQALLEDYGSQLDATAHSYVGRVRANTKRITEYIEQLLTLSRLSHAELRVERLDLSAVVGRQCEALCRAQPERAVGWTVTPGVSALGDRDLLSNCLRHLLENAWKFTGRREEARVEFTAETTASGEVTYLVRDNGIGFDMNYAGKLFGAFQRMHPPEDFPGAGIGLATAQRIIHRHGGRIWVAAAPEQGATFYFTLGRQTDDRGSACDNTASAAVDRSRVTSALPSASIA